MDYTRINIMSKQVIETRLLHNIAATTISVCGFLANVAMTILILRADVKKHKAMLFLLNLTLNSVLVCTVILPYIALQSFIVGDVSDVNMAVCTAMGYLTYSVAGSEIIGLTLVTLNRYIAIVRYKVYQLYFTSRRKIIILIVSSWLVYPTILAFPLSGLWGSFSYDPNRFFCHPFYASDSYSKFFLAFSLFLTIPVFEYCYTAIVIQIWSTHRTNKVGQLGNFTRLERHQRTKDIKLTVMVFVIVESFLCMYTPFGIFSVLDAKMTLYSPRIHVGLLYLAWSHCLVNPVIYVLVNSEIWTKLASCCRRNDSSRKYMES